MRKGIAVLVVSCLWSLNVFAAEAPPTKPSPKMVVTDGFVQTITESDGVVYMGGRFTRAGAWSGGGVLVDGTTGGLVPDFPKVNGPVSAAVSDGAGGYFIAGEFTKVGSVA